MGEKTVHQGKNVRRFREMLGMKQDALALAMGDDWNQQKISLLEQREVIDPSILEQVAKVLKINPEAIRNLTEEGPINIFSNTFSDFKDSASASAMNYQCTFNPLDKVIELYERMLKEKDSLIEKLINERNKK
jgi:transcriptional regulator with XRE-family HTH domain